MDFAGEFLRLKREKNAILLAHYYQVPEIQELADYVGDSLGLSQEAAKTEADIIVFAGVHFMAETAKILNPHKKVLLPDLEAGCSLADSCPPDQFEKFKQKYPDHEVVTYINCSAEIKAMSDLVCTSANAIKVVNSIPLDRKVIFAPDRNLGRFVSEKTGRPLVLWEGACIVHEAFSQEKLDHLIQLHPNVRIVVHPESEKWLIEKADYVGSTSGMIQYVSQSPDEVFIIATEAGILEKMHQSAPEKTLIPAPSHENNTCACSECPYMKMNTLEKLYYCLHDEKPEIFVAEHIAQKALLPIQRMLALS